MTDRRASDQPIRGREAVCDSLITAALELMSTLSPRQISGRAIAQRAGVNYGLIHHYFGSKDGLFAAAVCAATKEMGQRWDDLGILPVNTSDEAAIYRTFAKLEADAARSTMTPLIHRIVRGQCGGSERCPTDPELLAEVALCAALQFGWGTFEEEIMAGLAEFGAERDDMRARVAELSTRLLSSD